METPELKTEELSVPEPAVESKPVKPQRQETVWDTLRSLLIVLAGVLCIRTFVAEATVIPTGSMESTILIGDHVFLNKLLYGPRLPYTSLRMPPLRDIHRQDIVAFRYPRNPSVMFVKRVIGVGGDVVKIEDKRYISTGGLCSSLMRNSSFPRCCLCAMTFLPPPVCWKPFPLPGDLTPLGRGKCPASFAMTVCTFHPAICL